MSNANNVSLKRAKLHEVQHDGTSHVFVLNKGTLCEGPSPVLMLIDNAAVRIPASTAPYDVSRRRCCQGSAADYSHFTLMP